MDGNLIMELHLRGDDAHADDQRREAGVVPAY